MIAFTDDDLNSLKKNHFHTYPKNKCRDCALLSRLEAAELCARYLESIGEPDLTPVEIEALRVWRKAAGRT